jgi:hypothetical protein
MSMILHAAPIRSIRETTAFRVVGHLRWKAGEALCVVGDRIFQLGDRWTWGDGHGRTVDELGEEGYRLGVADTERRIYNPTEQELEAAQARLRARFERHDEA